MGLENIGVADGARRAPRQPNYTRGSSWSSSTTSTWPSWPRCGTPRVCVPPRCAPCTSSSTASRPDGCGPPGGPTAACRWTSSTAPTAGSPVRADLVARGEGAAHRGHRDPAPAQLPLLGLCCTTAPRTRSPACEPGAQRRRHHHPVRRAEPAARTAATPGRARRDHERQPDPGARTARRRSTVEHQHLKAAVAAATQTEAKAEPLPVPAVTTVVVAADVTPICAMNQPGRSKSKAAPRRRDPVRGTDPYWPGRSRLHRRPDRAVLWPVPDRGLMSGSGSVPRPVGISTASGHGQPGLRTYRLPRDRANPPKTASEPEIREVTRCRRRPAGNRIV